METKIDEARDLVRELIKEDLVNENIGKTITRDGEEIQITKPDEKSIRFDLPKMKKSYVLMSGRLYEKDFILDLSDPKFDQDESEDEKAPELSLVDVESSMVQQLDYKGKPEEVNTRLFKNKIVCKCGNVRWVKNADLFQVKKCKPCTYRDRLNRRKQKRTKK